MSSSDDKAQLQAGLMIAGRYRIVRRLGEGGMGSVYLVQHVHTEEKFALKVLHKAVISDSNALERFRREARTPARIDSEYVVRVTDADVAPELSGAPFLVMEYLRGEDIDQRIERAGAFSPGGAVALLKQTARALDKAHALGIVHRDLKPENLFLLQREDGSHMIKVLDFGIAKFTANTEDFKVTSETKPGAVFGTPLFMSPEQALDSSKVSTLTDVWALGLIAHRMLTASDYWTAETLTQLIAQIAYEPMAPPSERGSTLGASYDAWFLRCCARDPKARYPTAGEAVRELASALGLSDASMEVPRPVISVLPPSAAAVSARTAESSPMSFSDTQLAATGGLAPSQPPKPKRGALALAAAAGVGLIVIGWAMFGSSSTGSSAPGEPEKPSGGKLVIDDGNTKVELAIGRDGVRVVPPTPSTSSDSPNIVPVGSAPATPSGSTPAGSATPKAPPTQPAVQPRPRPPATAPAATPPTPAPTPAPAETGDAFESRY